MSDEAKPIARAIFELWVQTSADYTATRYFISRDIYRDTTVAELLSWQATKHGLQAGQIIIEDLKP